MYETYTGLDTDDVMRLISSYQRDFHVAVNPQMYWDDPSVLPPDSPYVATADNNGVRINYWSDDMQSLMAKSIHRIDSLLDEAFYRARRGDLYIKDEVRIESLASDVAQYLDMLMDGTASSLGDITFKTELMCRRLDL